MNRADGEHRAHHDETQQHSKNGVRVHRWLTQPTGEREARCHAGEDDATLRALQGRYWVDPTPTGAPCHIPAVREWGGVEHIEPSSPQRLRLVEQHNLFCVGEESFAQ